MKFSGAHDLFTLLLMIMLMFVIRVSGCCIYEEGCGCSNPKLPESSIEASMPPSQCHSSCIVASI